MGIIATLIVGAIAGWLGGTIYKGSGLGLIGNIIIGLLGSGVGYWLLGSVFNISLGEGWIASILTGAIVSTKRKTLKYRMFLAVIACISRF